MILTELNTQENKVNGDGPLSLCHAKNASNIAQKHQLNLYGLLLAHKDWPKAYFATKTFLRTAKPRNQIPRNKNKKLNMCFFGYLYLIIRQIRSQVIVIT